MRRWLPLAVGILAAPAAGAGEAGPARTALERFAANLDDLHAAFEQQVTDPEGRLVETGTGEVWVRRPDGFRWAYHGEFPELIVADGERIWLYDEVLEQVTVKSQSGLAQDTPLMLLTDLTGLDRQFSVSELGENDGMHLLELAANDREGEFERVILGLRGDALEAMILEDAFGIRTEIRFSDVERNPGLDPALFRFIPPPGVDVVGDLEAP